MPSDLVMRVLSVEPKPFHWLRYLNAAPGGRGVERARLPFYRAKLDSLPDRCDAVVFASDLQGRVEPSRYGDPERLLGEAVASELEALWDDRLIPSPADTGAILAGDLYSVPGAAKRGGFGDVAPVYEAFACAFAWVLGVAGNHDDVANSGAIATLLDGDVVSAGGVRIGGVGYVVGNKNKPGKRDEDEQLLRLELVLDEGVDVLVLHEGPEHAPMFEGSQAIRERILRKKTPLTVFGHTGWREPLVELSAGVMGLNVHERVIVATR